MDQARTLQGRTLYGEGHDKLGTIDTLYADREDGTPTFATVNTGLFGTKTSFVPLNDARVEGDDVLVPYSKDLVKDAPKIDEDADLEPDEEQRLYGHYGLTGGTSNQPETGEATGTDADGMYPEGQSQAMRSRSDV